MAVISCKFISQQTAGGQKQKPDSCKKELCQFRGKVFRLMCFWKNHSAYPEPEKFLSPTPCIDKRDNTACQSYNSISENSADKSFWGLGFSSREKFSCIAETVTASQNRNDLTDRKYFSCKQKQENSNTISRNMTTEKFPLNFHGKNPKNRNRLAVSSCKTIFKPVSARQFLQKEKRGFAPIIYILHSKI